MSQPTQDWSVHYRGSDDTMRSEGMAERMLACQSDAQCVRLLDEIVNIMEGLRHVYNEVQAKRGEFK
jgi:hypothetical protein